MNDDMGQQRLLEAEHPRSTTGGHLTSPRVEAAPEGQDVEMTATHAVGNAESSKSQSAEASGRMEHVSASRKHGAEEMGLPGDWPREISTVLMSLGVALVNFKVAELFCTNRFGDAAVDMGFERGRVVDCATGWDMEDEEQMKVVEVQRRVMEDEFVLCC